MDIEKHPKKKIDLDTILVEEIGQFGKFQLRTYILAAIVSIFISWCSTKYVFIAARTSTRCLIPECDLDEPEWSPVWLPDAIPTTRRGRFANCHRFGNASALLYIEKNTCPSSLFDRNTLQSCENYVYEDKNSLVYHFGLACNEWARSLIGTTRIFGAFPALPLTGYISDRWGRSVALSITAFNGAWMGVVRYWIDTYTGYMISEFMESIFSNGCFACAYILMMEFVGPKYRVVAGASMNTFFSCGTALMGMIAWAVPYWRHLTLALYVPQLLTISYFWLMSESARWYMSKGRFEDSEAVLKKAAKINGRCIPQKSLDNLRYNAEAELKQQSLEKQNSDDEWLVMTVFRHKHVLLCCIIAPIWWITSSFISFGLTINAVNISGDRYMNYFAVAVVEIPGHWVSVCLLSKVGRKPVLITFFWLCAACQLGYVFIPNGLTTLSLVVYLVAKFCIGVEIVALHVYTAELYPTVKRQSLFNFTTMIGRIGALVAPLTPAFSLHWHDELPFMLFAGFALLSGALVFLTPETLGTMLPDTFEQANEIGRENKNRESTA